ncbi:WD repeat-containing protein 19 [Homalodisca vitripennis]|uniref:WD repeat-containing protein 19 n=1 Tax=Homalodisca vitripennis TaxID=197043 RepID=UPI001EEB6775|nr:WD repeat-containing protein 19 [Homalodisca vitripennis]
MAHEKELFKLEQPHGPGQVYFSWQHGSGGYLATTGADNTVCIFNRHGKVEQRIRLPGQCIGLDWDCYGDLLAVICANATTLVLWDANTTKKSTVEVGLRDKLSCLVWAKTSPLLAVTTHSGNLSIYNHSTAKRIPVLGKHSKRITGGAWSSSDLLALGSEDKTLSINNADGDTLRVIQLRSEPAHLQFSEMKTDERLCGDNTVSVVVGKKTLFLYNLQDPDNPVELAFQSKYGTIVTYKWFGDGYVLLGFSGGYFVAISTHIKEVGQELFQAKNHRDCLTDIAVSHSLAKVVSCGDNTVKIHEMASLQDTPSVVSLDQEVERMDYSADGQLLAVATRGGSISVFLSKLPMLAAAYNSRVALLSSLTQITVYQLPFDKGKTMTSVVVEVEVEPSVLAVGPYHLVCAMNNRSWLYDLSRESEPTLLSDREYIGTVSAVSLNAEYTAVLLGHKIHLHYTESGGSSHGMDREMRMFPDEGEQYIVSSMALTTDFLIYASDMGHIWYFLLEDWVQVTEFQHVISIKAVYPDMVGTRLIFIDAKSDGYIYNPVTDDLVLIPDLPTSAAGVLWDTWHPDRNVFIVYDSENMYTYIHIRDSIKGQRVVRVGVTKLPTDQIPLVLHSGEVTLETSGGKLNSVCLSTHTTAPVAAALGQSDSLHSILDLHLALMRYNEAWNVCLILDEQEAWVKFGQSALRNLDVTTAIRVYRQVGDAGMVWSLESIQGVENKKLLAGHIAMFLQDFDLAQDLFLESSEPVTALTMRQDLLQWAEALRLATTLDPHQIPYISLQYANQLELTGNYSEALGHFERALTDGAGEHNASCRSGIARCAIRCGDYRRGITMATEHNASKQLRQQCAEILEQTKKMNEAASLYEKAECYDQAASVYIQLKNWTKLGELLPRVTSPKIHLQYAKGKEAVGDFRSAVQAYQRAGDLDSVVRISLDHLKDPQEAVRIVQETRSIEGAKLVAKFFQRIGDYSSAVRFLVISGCLSDAFRLSREQDQLELYADILAQECGDGEARAEFHSLALHFETAGKHLLAGKYYFHAEDYRKAMKHLLQASRQSPEDAEALTLAVQVAGRAGDDVLANQLVELLLGEVDGEARDPKYIFKLYMARGQYREAAKTAIIIANEEQVNGNYRSAHDVLLGMCQQLRHNQLTISSDLLSALMLLHSYILVRLHVCRGDHSKAACMLIRVVENISQFPCHIVPILTSAVIECHRAGLKSKAFHYATMLMRPEYRSQIEPKYSKKMEGVVRKPPRGPDNKLAPDPPETTSPCPYCEYSLPETQLSCTQCKNTIPFCIATGWHIVRNDLTICPNCNFPAICSQLEVLVEGGGTCPMCSEMVYPHQLARVDFDNYVQTYLQPPS